MATKPETKLALEMIKMQFMPAREGLNHLIREIENWSNDSEILITDDRYYRLFYASELLADHTPAKNGHTGPKAPLLNESSKPDQGKVVHKAILDPKQTRSWSSTDWMTRRYCRSSLVPNCCWKALVFTLGHQRKLMLKDVKAIQGLRFLEGATQNRSNRFHHSIKTDQLNATC